MSGESRGWHASQWNNSERQLAETRLKFLQDNMMAQGPYAPSYDASRNYRSHANGWAQREQSLERAQREKERQASATSESVKAFLRPDRSSASDYFPQRMGSLEIVENNSLSPAQLAEDVAFHHSQEFKPYINSVFHREGAISVSNKISDINHELIKMSVPLKFVTRILGPDDSSIVIDLLDNRNGRSCGALFLK